MSLPIACLAFAPERPCRQPRQWPAGGPDPVGRHRHGQQQQSLRRRGRACAPSPSSAGKAGGPTCAGLALASACWSPIHSRCRQRSPLGRTTSRQATSAPPAWPNAASAATGSATAAMTSTPRLSRAGSWFRSNCGPSCGRTSRAPAKAANCACVTVCRSSADPGAGRPTFRRTGSLPTWPTATTAFAAAKLDRACPATAPAAPGCRRSGLGWAARFAPAGSCRAICATDRCRRIWPIVRCWRTTARPVCSWQWESRSEHLAERTADTRRDEVLRLPFPAQGAASSGRPMRLATTQARPTHSAV
jgi:hypothetical protein